MGMLSTTRLAAKIGMERDDLVKLLAERGLIDLSTGKWELTERGTEQGGDKRELQDGNTYIVWPDSLGGTLGVETEAKPEHRRDVADGHLYSSAIAAEFGISPQRLNLILAEIGWITKHLKGWAITESGTLLGGEEHEHPQSGGHYVTWPASILEHRVLVAVLEAMTEEISLADSTEEDEKVQARITSFRTKNPGTYRTKDGHWVRSRAEVIIDDALYDYGIPHAYERRLPVEEEVYCDFYLPSSSLYIEFWGLENDPKYQERKKQKLEIYRKYNFKVIELSDTHLSNLDDHLPRFLLKHNVRVY